MAFQRRSGSRQIAGGRRRAPSTWSRFVSVAPVTVPAATKVLIASLVLNNVGISETVRRTRGMVMIGSDQVSVVENQLGSLGMIVVTELALSVGAASLPGPVTQLDDDGWFVWQPFMAKQNLLAQPMSQSKAVFEFDSKAMRRVEDGYAIAVMIENSSATTGLEAWLALSTLTSIS